MNETQSETAVQVAEAIGDEYSQAYLDALNGILIQSAEQKELLEEIKTEQLNETAQLNILQNQLVETYTLLAFIFLLLIIGGVFKFVSSLFNT